MAVNIRNTLQLGTKTIGSAREYQSLFPLITVLVKNIYVIASIILFIMIFIGGFGMILNAGNVESQKKSSSTLTSALAGFAILFASYWIIRIIEIVIGIKIFDPTI